MCFAGRPISPSNCSLGCASFVAALENSHPECLNYWHMVRHQCYQMHHQKGQNEHDGPHMCREAAQMQSAEELMNVHDVLRLPWDAGTCKLAACWGSVDCLSFAHASGCPWDQSTCAAAAAFGNLHCLAYAHEQGCEWSSFVVQVAAAFGELECLKYAHTHGCPYTANRPLCFDWTHSHFWSSRSAIIPHNPSSFWLRNG